MAGSGPWTWFNKALSKPFDNTVDLDSHAFVCALLDASQVIDQSFVGSSGNAEYSDVTGELATANGYTHGGLNLSSISILTASPTSRLWTAADLSWTLTGSIAVKYAAIFDNTTVTKDLVCFCDFNPGGGALTISVSPLVITTSSGILSWHT